QWITDAAYETPPKQSPAPMTFRTRFTPRRPVRRAWVESTALGVYEVELNGRRPRTDYFAPGFASYRHQLQYQTYDADVVSGENTLLATVGGGWAVGSYTHKRVNKIYADRQALLCELHVEYDDGTYDVFATGPD